MINIDKEVNSAIEILTEEYGYYNDLSELAKSKKKIIVEGKIAELDKMVKLEQNMIFNIGQLERKREDIVSMLCKALNMNSAQITVSELAKVLKPELKNRLEDIQEKLQKVLSELKDANDVNGQLLEQSLEYIDYSINLVAGSGMETGSLYGDTGKNKGKQGSKNIIDTKI
ncbi:MAG: flagellar protein FlgN [Clostridiaceae bacterium]|nr:flagellar protein FlgN [Clostridiaceae bacterium]